MEAAGLPIVALTASTGLQEVRLSQGEVVLIQAASGGAGHLVLVPS